MTSAAEGRLLPAERLSVSARTAVLAATALAAVGAIFMNLNFHLANGSAHRLRRSSRAPATITTTAGGA